MFCSHCGKEVAAGAKFCANCGAAVNSQPTPAAELPKAPASTAQREVPAVEQVGSPSGNMTGSGSQPEKKKKGVPKKPLIIVVAVLVLIVGFGAILSLFGDGSEPDSGSEEQASEIISVSGKGKSGNHSDPEDTAAPIVAPSPPDWIVEIHERLGRIPTIGDLSDNYNYLSLETHHTVSYSKLEDTMGPYFEYFGVPDSDEIQYYEGNNDFFGVSNDQIVYELWVKNQVVSNCYYPVHRPVIVKNDTGIYYLLYKLENCYIIYVTEPSDLAASYLTWDVLYEIRVASEKYCDLLNGKQPLEKVGIPEEDFPLPEWVNDIPAVVGDMASWESVFSNSKIKYVPYPSTNQAWPDGFTESDLFIYSVVETEYDTTYVVVEDGIESYIGSGYALIPKTRETVGSYRIVWEQEPLIGRDAINQAHYYLFYKRDSGYEIYKVWANAPVYQDWSIDAIFYVADPRCFTYMNGERDLEIISTPGQSMQAATEPTATAPGLPADSSKTPNDGAAGTADTPALPEGAQYVSKLEEYVADPTSLDLTLGRESDYTSLSLGRQRNMLDYPLDYLGTKAIFPWPLKVLSSGETQNGYRYYVANEMDNSIAEGDKLDVMLIDVRENATEDIKAIGDEFRPYLVFAGGVHTDEGWYIVFFVTADI